MDGRGRAFDNIFVERFWRNVKHEDVYLKGYSTMIELTVGLAEYFTFYNSERPHQSLGQETPDVVYKTAMGGGAMIVDKYPRAVDGTPVPSTAESVSEVPTEAKAGQRRPAALEVECTA
jgi:putative transposase